MFVWNWWNTFGKRMDPCPWLVYVFLRGGFCNSFPCLILQGRINRNGWWVEFSNVAGKSTISFDDFHSELQPPFREGISQPAMFDDTGGVGPRLWRCQVQLPPVFEICVRKLRVGRVHCMAQLGHAAVHWDHVKHPPKRLNSWQADVGYATWPKHPIYLASLRKILSMYGTSPGFLVDLHPLAPAGPRNLAPSADASEVGMWSQIGVVWTSQIDTWESPVDLKNRGSSGFMTLISWD